MTWFAIIYKSDEFVAKLCVLNTFILCDLDMNKPNLGNSNRSALVQDTFFSPEQNTKLLKLSYYFYFVCLFLKTLQCVIALTNEVLLYLNVYQEKKS